MEAIPEAEFPPCESNLFSLKHYANMEFIGRVTSKIQEAFYMVAEMVGLLEEKHTQPPASWEEVVTAFEDMPGLKVIIKTAMTLWNFEDKLLVEYYADEVIQLPAKGIRTFSSGLTEANT